MIANGYFLRVIAERWGITGTDLVAVNACADRLNDFDRAEAALRDSLGDESYFVQAARDKRYDDRDAELALQLNKKARGLR